MSLTFLDTVIDALKSASAYNRNDVVAPVAILWPDGEKEWMEIAPKVCEHLPVLTLGPYAPENRTGPAIWIRCMLTKCLPDADWPDDVTPIVYLPGYSRADLRIIEECPKEIKLLAELQYRGVIWSQKSGRDWTLAAFLQSSAGGLGIPVDSTNGTRQALRRASGVLLDEPVERLKAKAPLKAAFFNELLTPDLHKSVLQWMNDPERWRSEKGDLKWAAFHDQCRKVLGFDPEKDGELIAAEKLGKHESDWAETWERFKEAPRSYPNIPSLLRQAKPVQARLVFEEEISESWPQDNEAQEEELRKALLKLNNQPIKKVRETITDLESSHSMRRGWVWSALGQAPLANALEHLVLLCESTTKTLGTGSMEDLADRYLRDGWKTDSYVMHTLSCVRETKDADAVGAVIRALYAPWLQDVCEAFQSSWDAKAPELIKRSIAPEKGVVYIFVDGLRLDIAYELKEALTSSTMECELSYRLAPMPSVTETAKPAASPVADRFVGGPELNAATLEGSVVNITVLRKTLEEAGYSVLMLDETGNPEGSAWTEAGEFDEVGHVQGWRLAFRAAEEIELLVSRIRELLDAGWSEVRIVTDHGWLLLPGGLPDYSLPIAATELRKGRCARLKQGAKVDVQTVPWFWDQTVQIGIAPGIKCFVAGKDYEHGGMSPQELVVPEMVVKLTEARPEVSITEAKWTGLRIKVQLAGTFQGLSVDMRTRPADPNSSVVESPKCIATDGSVTLFCADDKLEGSAAIVVVFRPEQENRVLAQRPVIIGGENDRL